jgi:hypothetical protein
VANGCFSKFFRYETNRFLEFQIIDALELDPTCKKQHLANKLENVASTLEGEDLSC